jgi:5-methylcytosine-specific restriction endonuclease McrA
MNRYSLTHLSHGVLLQTLHEKVVLGRRGNAEVLALIAEVDKRKLYRPAPCSSMYAYCIERLGFSEDEAYNRIHAARAARRYPVIFEMIADGRLRLIGARLLRKYLTPATAAELLEAATHKTRKQIEQLLADRFPRPDVPAQIVALPAPVAHNEARPELVLEQVGQDRKSVDVVPAPALAEHSAVAPPCQNQAPPLRVEPLGTKRYGLHATIDERTNDLLQEAQDLVDGPPAGRVPQILYEALLDYVAKLRKRKFAATDKPRVGKPSSNPRYIPARVKRAVEKRDGGQCAFIGDSGRRCDATRDIEFDHVMPVAKGGESTVANVRLLCRTHNQLEAERVFGHAFMNGKRPAAEEARRAAP